MNADSIKIEILTELSLSQLGPLLVESREQGFRFVETLITEYESGVNRFDRRQEALYGLFIQDQLVAVGGLNLDPYLQDESVGRVRHLYVLNEWRRKGIGRLLVERIIQAAQDHFRLLTLRTFDDEADQFYRALGFVTEPAMASVSHHMWLNDESTVS